MPLRKGRHPPFKEVKILKHKKIMILALMLLLLTVLCCTSAFAAGGDVAGAVEQTWKEAAKQIKSVVEKVVFPALDMILATRTSITTAFSWDWMAAVRQSTPTSAVPTARDRCSA